MPRKKKEIPNDENPGVVAGTKSSNKAMEGSKQEPLGKQRKSKGVGNVRPGVNASNYGTTWLDFARPYMKREKTGGMKKASADWKKYKSKMDKKKKKKKK